MILMSFRKKVNFQLEVQVENIAEESIEEGDEDEEEIRDEHENPILKDARLTPLQGKYLGNIS